MIFQTVQSGRRQNHHKPRGIMIHRKARRKVGTLPPSPNRRRGQAPHTMLSGPFARACGTKFFTKRHAPNGAKTSPANSNSAEGSPKRWAPPPLPQPGAGGTRRTQRLGNATLIPGTLPPPSSAPRRPVPRIRRSSAVI